MRATDSRVWWKQLAGLAVGVSALVFTTACGATPTVAGAAAPQASSPGEPGAPVMVSCEPHQRTVVRPAVVNGAAVSHVECVAAAQQMAPVASQPVAYAPAPVGYAPVAAAPAPRRASPPVYADLGDAQVVPVASAPARTVRTSQVIYEERPVKKTRSVKKSAVIIGASAGAGAGVGAAIGGKKGALIGAAIGGGGATVWDQVTRRK